MHVAEPQPTYYANIPATVRYDVNLSPNAKLLYGELTALSNKHGFCWAGNKYFADLYKVSNRSIQRWLEELKDHIVITQEGEQRQISIVNRRPMTKMSYPHEEIVTPPHEEIVTLNTTSNNTTDIKYPFSEFWNTYNKKVGDRTKCEKKWQKLGAGDREKIMATLPAFLKQFSDKQYQPFPATYLNQRRWEDEIQAPASGGKINIDEVQH